MEVVRQEGELDTRILGERGMADKVVRSVLLA
jgi:hypothetical protein